MKDQITPSPAHTLLTLPQRDGQGVSMDDGNSGSGSGSSDEEGMAGFLEVDEGGLPVGMDGGAKRADGTKGSSRPRGESSVKRKEQNRVAQRAFRKRQKAYFKDLEREVIDKGSQLRVITRNNEYLLQTMKQLQNENLALKASNCPPDTVQDISHPGFMNGSQSYPIAMASPLNTVTQLVPMEDGGPLRSPGTSSEQSMRRISDDTASIEADDVRGGTGSTGAATRLKASRRGSGPEQAGGRRKSTNKRKAEEATLDVDMTSPRSVKQQLSDGHPTFGQAGTSAPIQQSPLNGWRPLSSGHAGEPQHYHQANPYPPQSPSFAHQAQLFDQTASNGGYLGQYNVTSNPYAVPQPIPQPQHDPASTKSRARRYSEALGNYHAQPVHDQTSHTYVPALNGPGQNVSASWAPTMAQGSMPFAQGFDPSQKPYPASQPAPLGRDPQMWQNPPTFHPTVFGAQNRGGSSPDAAGLKGDLNSMTQCESMPASWPLTVAGAAYSLPKGESWNGSGPAHGHNPAGQTGPTYGMKPDEQSSAGSSASGGGDDGFFKIPTRPAGGAVGMDANTIQALRPGANSTMMPVMGVITPMDGNGPADNPFRSGPDHTASPSKNSRPYLSENRYSSSYQNLSYPSRMDGMLVGADPGSPSSMFGNMTGNVGIVVNPPLQRSMLGIATQPQHPATGYNDQTGGLNSLSPYPYTFSPGASPGRLDMNGSVPNV